MSSGGRLLPTEVRVRIAADESSSGDAPFHLGIGNAPSYARILVHASSAGCPSPSCTHGRRALRSTIAAKDVDESIELGLVDHGAVWGRWECAATLAGPTGDRNVDCFCDCFEPPEPTTMSLCALTPHPLEGKACTSIELSSSGDVAAMADCDVIVGDLKVDAGSDAVHLPRLRRIIGELEISSTASVSMPLLASTRALVVYGWDVVDLDLPRLHTTCGGELYVGDCGQLTALRLPLFGGGSVAAIRLLRNNDMRSVDIGSVHGGPRVVTGRASNGSLVLLEGHAVSARFDTFVGLWGMTSVAPTPTYYQEVVMRYLGADTSEAVASVGRAVGVGTHATATPLRFEVEYVDVSPGAPLDCGGPMREVRLERAHGITRLVANTSAIYLTINDDLVSVELLAPGGLMEYLGIEYNDALREVTMRGPATEVGSIYVVNNPLVERVLLPAVGAGTTERVHLRSNALREVDVGSEHGGPTTITGYAGNGNLLEVRGLGGVRIDSFVGLGGLTAITPTPTFAQRIYLEYMELNTSDAVHSVFRAAGVGTGPGDVPLMVLVSVVLLESDVDLATDGLLGNLYLKWTEGITGIRACATELEIESNVDLATIELLAPGGSMGQFYVRNNDALREVTMRGPATEVAFIDIATNPLLERVLMPAVGAGTTEMVHIHSGGALREVDVGSEHGGPTTITGFNADRGLVDVRGLGGVRIDSFVGMSNLVSITPTPTFTQTIELHDLGANASAVRHVLAAINGEFDVGVQGVLTPGAMELSGATTLRSLIVRYAHSFTSLKAPALVSVIGDTTITDNAALPAGCANAFSGVTMGTFTANNNLAGTCP
eukprot:TRINITY_DN1045_c0_g1_i2.p1 TRINITY_DN1045_c0_g1~~TRINITY_DN1045_c0_g1_i2.p1  ORF type:complete len:832 (-),score=187.27 TRINITY_DN1045_c0_g1_i2:551-3046(-)